MRPLTCGSPSLSLCSCLTSSLVMRSFLKNSQYCHGTSSATTSSSEPATSAQHANTSSSMRSSASWTGALISPIASGSRCQTTHAPTVPTSSDLATALTSSTSECE